LVSHLLGICRAGWYKNRGKLKFRDERLKEDILEILKANPGYGHRRIALALSLGKRRVRRVMRLFGIKPYKRKARWSKKRDRGRLAAKYPNLIKNSCPIKPGIILAGDFTRIPYRGGIVYLTTFIDLYTREIVGWSVATRHTSDLVINSLFDAIKTLGKIPLTIHTDQGAEYTGGEYTRLLEKLGIRVSLSRKRSPWENGYQESFYDNFKTDLGLEFDRFESLGELIEAVHQTIAYYNQTRIHTSLKMSPRQFLHLYNQRT